MTIGKKKKKITRGGAVPRDERDVIDGDVARLASHARFHDHLVDSRRGHVTLCRPPLVPLVS